MNENIIKINNEELIIDQIYNIKKREIDIDKIPDIEYLNLDYGKCYQYSIIYQTIIDYDHIKVDLKHFYTPELSKNNILLLDKLVEIHKNKKSQLTQKNEQIDKIKKIMDNINEKSIELIDISHEINKKSGNVLCDIYDKLNDINDILNE